VFYKICRCILNLEDKFNILSLKVKVKGKAVPLQAWTGLEVFRRLRLPDFKRIGTRRW